MTLSISNPSFGEYCSRTDANRSFQGNYIIRYLDEIHESHYSITIIHAGFQDFKSSVLLDRYLPPVLLQSLLYYKDVFSYVNLTQQIQKRPTFTFVSLYLDASSPRRTLTTIIESSFQFALWTVNLKTDDEYLFLYFEN
ncbi:hypothetical protein BDA99DRAFT_541847 [Phascolomyces articulosus]|uniref:Uncharacterized protein n=1 Tax=Phascolomyces articulosus TaxID=60185 RepID=A0AAD5K449_9FUNG|nr:hypothetical protein BDA99DRAFT_541847 [Phascolomyces articulosus]